MGSLPRWGTLVIIASALSPDPGQVPQRQGPLLPSLLVPCPVLPVAGPLARALAGLGARCSPEHLDLGPKRTGPSTPLPGHWQRRQPLGGLAMLLHRNRSSSAVVSQGIETP